MVIASEGAARGLAGGAEAPPGFAYAAPPRDPAGRCLRRDRDTQLEVLAAGGGELRGRDAKLSRHLRDPVGERQRRELDLDVHAAAGGEMARVRGDPVAEVDQRVGAGLHERAPL